MTDDEIFALGYQAGLEMPALPDDVVTQLAVILAPLADRQQPEQPDVGHADAA